MTVVVTSSRVLIDDGHSESPLPAGDDLKSPGLGGLRGLRFVLDLPEVERRAVSGVDEKLRAGLLIVPLANAIDQARERHAGRGLLDAVLLGERSTPYMVLVQVLFTLGQKGFRRYHLMALQDVEPSPSSPPQASVVQTLADPPPSQSASSALNLSVFITSGGVSFKTSGGKVGAGCVMGAPGITVPTVAGAHDVGRITECAARIKGSRSDSGVTLTASPAIELGVVLDVMDALRGGGAQLFWDVHFGISR